MDEWIDGSVDFEKAQGNVFEKARELTSFLELHCNTFDEKSGLTALSADLKEKMSKVKVHGPATLESITPESVSDFSIIIETLS